MKSVSVIIPNFNRAKMVRQTVQSLLGQTLPPTEIIVVDDGSTDDSIAVLKALDAPVIVKTQKNSGPAVARNVGLAAATGEFVQFLDNDDLCSLNKIEAQVAALTSSGADIAYGPWLPVTVSGTTIEACDLVRQQAPIPASPAPALLMMRGWVVLMQACLFRRSLLSKSGYFRPELIVVEDSEYLFRMLLGGASLVHVPEVMTFYRMHSEDKLTDSGVGVAKRRFNLEALFVQMTAQLSAAHVSVDWRTKLMFDVWRLRNGGTQTTRASHPLVSAVEIFDRLKSSLQGRLFGTRLSGLYRWARPTLEQLELARQLSRYLAEQPT